MNTSLESKALALAVLAASISLGGSLLVAIPIKHFALGGMGPQRGDAAMPEIIASADPALVAKGRENFVMSCVECHGDDATGDEGPDLHQVEVSDRYISNIVTHGIKGEMPSFRKKLGKDEIVKLTAYVRSLD